MDPLTQAMLTRAMLPQQPIAAQPQPQPTLPVVPPANDGKTNTPPKLERFKNAQAMIAGFQNGWNPNPILLQAQRGVK